MKKFVMAALITLTVGLVGCSSTSEEGGDKASKQSKSSNMDCKDTGSRLKKRC